MATEPTLIGPAHVVTPDLVREVQPLARGERQIRGRCEETTRGFPAQKTATARARELAGRSAQLERRDHRRRSEESTATSIIG